MAEVCAFENAKKCHITMKKTKKKVACVKGCTCDWSTEKTLTALCLLVEMIVWGMFVGMVNTSILDLELLTQTSTAQISLLWTAITVGSGCMAPIAGLLLDKVDCRLYLGLCQLGFGILIACLPLARNFVQIMAIAASLGIFLGLLDIGRNVTSLTLWGWDGAMWMQFYHFIFALGSAVAPLFTKPYLAMPIDNPWNSTLDSIPYNETSTSIVFTNSTEGTVTMSMSRIHIVFAIIGFFKFLGGVFSIIAFLVVRNLKHKECQEKREEVQVSTMKQERWYVIITVVLLFLRFCFIVGVELTIGALHMTFLVKGLGWTKSDAVMAVFTFRVTFAATRGVGVGLAKFITPTKLMFVDIGLLIISVILLWISGSFPDATWMVWLSTGLAGSAVATFFSASMSWAEKYLQVSGRIGGFFLLGSHCGVLAFPALCGYLFQTYTPWCYVYVCMGLSIMLLLTTAASAILGKWYRKRHPDDTDVDPSELKSLNQ